MTTIGFRSDHEGSARLPSRCFDSTCLRARRCVPLERRRQGASPLLLRSQPPFQGRAAPSRSAPISMTVIVCGAAPATASATVSFPARRKLGPLPVFDARDKRS